MIVDKKGYVKICAGKNPEKKNNQPTNKTFDFYALGRRGVGWGGAGVGGGG